MTEVEIEPLKTIYNLPAKEAEFENFCGGNLGGEHESCVEVAAIPGAAPSYVLHDSKPEGAGRELRFTEKELDEFAVGWVRKQGLTL
ncbi:DUF397 domain-containing protein [Streptomyces sp. NBC_01716]|uniref:DUF397 domain-containing protein n=1 Tax=Streptomyces sp. NBC_01716 TaxID=2975917 RepID=UPI002E30CAC9|nr:DUF397 domain-containing protein [Streptomyces sp. NBC_01716]